MTDEMIASALGLGEVFAQDVLAMQLVILAATVAAFVFSLAMMVMTGRAATSARRARAEAEGLLRSAQDFAVEARQLAAKLDRGAERAAASPDAKPAAPPTRVSARETTPEAEVEIISHEEQDRAARNLEAAKEAASVPARLLGGLRRRRR
jgi:biopolymer transport protein ExbB/TolQ